MNIDKKLMEIAYNRRAEPVYNAELMGYFEQMSNYFARKFAVKASDRSDLKQEALIVAVKALEKYKSAKKSTPFSYFYKVFHTAFMYHLRKQKMKNDRRPKTCSLEVLPNLGTAFEEFPNEENLIAVNGEIYIKEELYEKVRIATKLARKAMKLSNRVQRKKLIEENEDLFVKDFAYRYIDKRCRK